MKLYALQYDILDALDDNDPLPHSSTYWVGDLRITWFAHNDTVRICDCNITGDNEWVVENKETVSLQKFLERLDHAIIEAVTGQALYFFLVNGYQR